MSPLWGSRKTNPEDGEHDRDQPQVDGRDSRDIEADERTRLLPPRGQAYLSPDDPAVSH